MEKIVKLDDKLIRCIISKRSKKNIIFRFKQEELHISIPKRFPLKELGKIIDEKKDWIIEKFEENLFHKDVILFLGKEYASLEELRNSLTINYNGLDFPEIAAKIFNERVNIWTQKTNFIPQNIKIRKLKSAWGICYRNKNITLNFLLLCCPIDVIDYVIIHELCHIKHMNHSNEFWEEVFKYCPNFKIYKKWLKINGSKIFATNYF